MQDREFVGYQVWRQTNGSFELKHNIFRRQWSGGQEIPTDSLDYSGYPVNELGVAGGFYKFILNSEPYRDENWFGFWSTTSVFGLVGLVNGPTAYKATPHRSNGNVDFRIDSAESIYEYLQSQGSTFPQWDGINNVAGIDEQPGYL